MPKKTLSSIRVSDRTHENMKSAIDRYNQRNWVKISLQEFRRLSYEYLAQHILDGKDLNEMLEIKK